MPKRFTDTEKWARPWFRALAIEYKCLWLYILDKCDIAGIWYVDLEMAGFIMRTIFDVEKSRKILEKQIIEIDSGKRWWIKEFARFQYGTLREGVHLHDSVIKLMSSYEEMKNELEALRVTKGLAKGSLTLKDKDKDKDKDIVVGGVQGGFDKFWDAYPKKVGRKPCEKIWDRIVPGQDVLEKILLAIKDQRGSQNWQRGFIPNPETWLNQERWNDDAGALKGGENGNGWKTGSGRIVGGAAPVPGKYDHLG